MRGKTLRHINRRTALAVVVSAVAVFSPPSRAQNMPDSYAQPPAGYGTAPTMGYGTAPTPSYGAPGSMPTHDAGRHSIKQAFAGTLAAVLQTTTLGAAGALTGVFTGAIQSWFNRPRTPPPAPTANMNAMPAAMSTAMPTTSGMGAGAPVITGSMPGTNSIGPDSMGATTMGASTGMGASTSASSAMMMPAVTPAIYAGLAYEVQVRTSAGGYVSVDPATHSFATGERFTVLYRPSLPGEVIVMNVNPHGVEKQIDRANVAAGELARLGPYEFRDSTGKEQLRLILSPCRTDAMMATTRDIVKVDEPVAQVAATSPAPGFAVPGIPGLALCGTTAGTRAVRPQTRDIAKVEADGSTLFALDQVTPQELSSGQIASREVTITFTHR